MKKFPKIAAVAALAGAAVLASVLPGSADVSTQSPSASSIKVESPATVVARGVALRVVVTVTCPVPYVRTSVNVLVTQRSGNDVAQGNGYVNSADCTGAPETLEVLVTSQSGIFRQGVAFASANTYVSSLGSFQDQREIGIVR